MNKNNTICGKKRIAIWGTGKISTRFSEMVRGLEYVYIDNDVEKRGTTFNSKMVMISDEIKDYHQFFIIVACKAYDEIKEQLLKRGLNEGTDFIHYSKYNVDNDKLLIGMLEELEQSKKRVETEYEQYKNGILVFGSMITFEPKSIPILNEISIKTKLPFLLVSERPGIEERAQKEDWKFDFFVLPKMLLQNEHLCQTRCGEEIVDDDANAYVNEREYRKHAVQNFEGKNPDILHGYAELFVYHADRYLRWMIEFLSPSRIYIWNEFYPFHELVKNVCGDMGIDLLFVEYGPLTGTFLVEKEGQMGESFPATEIEDFQSLEINEEDIWNARHIYSYLATTKSNRRIQPDNDELEKVLRKLDSRPRIVYLGQNDYESGMYPYSDNAKKYHSPIFSSSLEAAIFLANLCTKNGWNFIYKPHPLCIRDVELNREKIPQDVFVINKCNINDLVGVGDLNITILSTSAYVSLVCHKPVLMLGYTQLRGKNCTYEAFEKGKIESEMKMALAHGFSDTQREAFIEHIARIVKYYAYDDESERHIRYGRDWHSLLNDD